MEVHCDESLADYIGLGPSAAVREGGSEASAGECIGQPLSRESFLIPGADAVASAEGNTDGRAIASTRPARRGLRTWHVQTLFVREPGYLAPGRDGNPVPARIGKARSRSR